MTDERLRHLERRWRETGSVDDEAALLRERVRAGSLTEEHLQLAAYCGHAGAREALGTDDSADRLETRVWLRDLSHRFGQEESVRAAVALASALPELARTHAVRDALRSAENWLARRPAEVTSGPALSELFMNPEDAALGERDHKLALIMAHAVRATLGPPQGRLVGWGIYASKAAETLLRWNPDSAGVVGSRVRQALREWAVSWF